MKHGETPEAILSRYAVGLASELTPEQTERLLHYEAILGDHGVRAGAVADSDRPRLLERHIGDSLRAAAEVSQEDHLGYDIGSGAGLPGIVVAVACPWLQLRLVEPQRRRVAVLELVVERLDLSNVDILSERVESLTPAEADLAFARAFAPVEESWAAAERVLRGEGRLVYFSGARTAIQAPRGTRIVGVREAALESAGPLVIIAR